VPGTGWLVGHCGHDRAAQVARAQLAQAVVVRGVVIDARGQVRQVAAREVELEVVPRSGALPCGIHGLGRFRDTCWR